MIYVVFMIQIVTLIFFIAFGIAISDEQTQIKVETNMTWKYALGFLSRYCAEHPDYGKSVFPETWEKIQEEKENE